MKEVTAERITEHHWRVLVGDSIAGIVVNPVISEGEVRFFPEGPALEALRERDYDSVEDVLQAIRDWQRNPYA